MSGCRLTCPECGHDHNKAAGESTIFEGVVYRRRRCQKCDHRFSTVEIHMPDTMRHVYRYTRAAAELRKAGPAARALSRNQVLDRLRMLGQPEALKKVPLDHKKRVRLSGKGL